MHHNSKLIAETFCSIISIYPSLCIYKLFNLVYIDDIKVALKAY